MLEIYELRHLNNVDYWRSCFFTRVYVFLKKLFLNNLHPSDDINSYNRDCIHTENKGLVLYY